MAVLSRANLTKHESCHLFALSLINTQKRREDFTAENINNVLRKTGKIGLSIYKSIHKILHKAGTYLSLIPEHCCRRKELFSVMCDGTEQQSRRAALISGFLCVCSSQHEPCGFIRAVGCGDVHWGPHRDLLHL